MLGCLRKRLRATVPALVLLAGTAAWQGCTAADSESRAREASNGAARVVPVAVITAAPSVVEDVLILPGQTEAWQDVLLSAEQSGIVEWIGPREGAKVAKGELVAQIDRAALKAALDRAEAAFALADALYQRRKRLADRNIINQEALDHAETDRSVAEGNLKQARVEYERAFVRSPIRGRVNRLYVDEGEFVNRGEALVDLVNVDRIEIKLNVPEMDVRFFRRGQEARVRVDALPEAAWTGVVDFVAYKAHPATRTFEVKVRVDNPESRIRPGMISRVALVRRTIPDAVMAPLFSLVDKGGERLIFVEEEGVARARTVEIGVITGDRVQILQGLEPGERLIVKGQTEVEEGTKVRIQ